MNVLEIFDTSETEFKAICDGNIDQLISQRRYTKTCTIFIAFMVSSSLRRIYLFSTYTFSIMGERFFSTPILSPAYICRSGARRVFKNGSEHSYWTLVIRHPLKNLSISYDDPNPLGYPWTSNRSHVLRGFSNRSDRWQSESYGSAVWLSAISHDGINCFVRS